MPLRMPSVFGHLLIVALLFLMAGCSHGGAAQDVPPAVIDDHGMRRIPDGSPLRDRLKVAAVETRDIAHPLSAPAEVEADPAHTVNVLPPATGRIVAVKVALGQRVKRGDVLAVIASADYAQAVADEARARDALALAEKAKARTQGVSEAGGAAVKEVEAAESAYVQARAEYDRAAARVEALGARTVKGRAQGMTVTSPVDGTITALSAAVGGFANDVTVPLMTVTDLGHVWVTANVAEDDVREIALGQQAEVVLPAWPQRTFKGQVQSISDVLDADSRRVKVRVALNNDDSALKANMYATATFQVPAERAVLVPASALLMDNDAVTVFVETSPWTFARRTVEIGSDEGDDVRIVKGLAAGERVIVAGGVLIHD